MKHETFKYRKLKDVKDKLSELNCSLPLNDEIKNLQKQCSFGNVLLPNRLGISPMEGADSTEDGLPTELTKRRYTRFAEGGAGLIWFEAVAVVPEGRSSKRQLVINKNNIDVYRRLIDDIKEAGMKKNGFAPYIVMQANHSGRYAKPQGTPMPIIAHHNPYYEKLKPVDSSRIATDDYLMQLEEQFGEASFLCREAGFDGIDIKSCHGYLFAELSAAYTRKGKYGGDFDNRFRLLIESIKNAKQAENKDFTVTARIGIHDGIPYPYGFGCKEGDQCIPDYEEAKKIIGILHNDLQLPFINITMGNPYENPHVTRPYDHGKYIPNEHPLEGLSRIYEGCGEIKKAFPTLGVAASAPSYLRQYSVNLADGAIEKGVCDVVCFGRMSFANPNFANEVIHEGKLNPKNVCITCGKCAELLRAGKSTGCVIRDIDEYLPRYKEFLSQQV